VRYQAVLWQFSTPQPGSQLLRRKPTIHNQTRAHHKTARLRAQERNAVANLLHQGQPAQRHLSQLALHDLRRGRCVPKQRRRDVARADSIDADTLRGIDDRIGLRQAHDRMLRRRVRGSGGGRRRRHDAVHRRRIDDRAAERARRVGRRALR